MSVLIEPLMKEALENAQKLKIAGENELCKRLCVSCVEKAAYNYGEDMISFFYGEDAYNCIEDAADALKYIFIAKCAAEVYNEVVARYHRGANSIDNLRDVQNAEVRDFYEWYSARGKKVSKDDNVRFKKLMIAFKNLK